MAAGWPARAVDRRPRLVPASRSAATEMATTRRFSQDHWRLAADGVEFGQRVGGQGQVGGGDVLAQVGY